MLYIPKYGDQRTENNVGSVTNEYGTNCQANATPHTKATSYTTLVASTAYDAHGVFLHVSGPGASGTVTAALLDIAIGAASSEQIIIPDLMCGNSGVSNGAYLSACAYYFPIRIPAGVRVSGRSQCAVGGQNIYVGIHLLRHSGMPGGWFGQRVTAYGVNTSTSSGATVSVTQNTYATVNVTASSTNPVKYLQLGHDLANDSGGSTSRGLLEVLAASQVLVDDLPYNESTTTETVQNAMPNFILSTMMFNLPAGIALAVGAMRSVTAETRGFALYGVN
jgi:hypothetical protein